MHNTGTEYLSTERKPHVLDELAALLPPLSEEQRSSLEADLLSNGCYSPIVVNEDLAVVDGHNRFEICEAHNIPFRMLVFAFQDMLEAKQWMVNTQRGRRNLQPWELGKIALKMQSEIEAHARANQSAAGGSKTTEALRLNSDKAPQEKIDTRQVLADSVGLSRDTMSRVMKIDQEAPEPVKEALNHRELSLNQGYNITKQVQKLPEEEREQAAAEAVEQVRNRKTIQQKDAERERKAKIAKAFSTAFEKACAIDVTEENVGFWVECSRMTPSEMEDMVSEARELSEVFSRIGDIIEQNLLPKDWRDERGTEEDPH